MTSTKPAASVTLLGVGHVFDLRRQVTDEIARRMPDVVALELDPARWRALRAPPETPREGPIAYRAMASFQDRLARAYGVRAGDEMRAAADIARDLRVPIALIDMEAATVMQRLRREMPFGEKARLALSTLGGLFIPARGVEAQVEQLASDYGPAFDEMARKFPTLKRILLDDRNHHMARALARLHREGRSVVAVVGDGHVDGVTAALLADGVPTEAVRLREMRRTDGPAEGTATAHFEVETRLD
ncbi:MAG TPA: TraB/GumN family protein [Candidatus Thermoplasmatota archaeon]|nr:TraB/GumN family protein [Candidatus Thermoplasmatota archaeon]